MTEPKTDPKIEVNVNIDGKPRKGTIQEMLSAGAARIELRDGGSVQAVHSLSGDDGTFYYASEKLEKPQPAAAAESAGTKK